MRIPSLFAATLAALFGCTQPGATRDGPTRLTPAAGPPAMVTPVTPSPRAPVVVAADGAVREMTVEEQVKHVLNRLAFGTRPGDVEAVRAMSVDRWIARQLDPARINDSETDRFLSRFQTLALSPAELMRQYPTPQMLMQEKRRELARDGLIARGDSGRPALALSREDSMQIRQMARQSVRVAAELQAAKVARAVVSERQLNEVMVDFWLNHFNVFAGKGPERYLLASYERDAIRPRALGSFRELLGAVAKSPAMLFYLDNAQSAVDSGRPSLTARGGLAGASEPARMRARGRRPIGPRPGDPRRDSLVKQLQQRRPRGLNENYARELLELHTVGVDGGYTQQDVINVARALTGWSIDQPRQGGGFVFRPQMHDAGTKVVLGHTLPAGRGIEDGEQVLDILARHPSTATFIAGKLARRFVSDSPPPALVARAAETFRRTDGDIREVVRTIVTSPEFFSRSAYRSKVKSPFELVVSAARALDARPDSTPRTAQVVARLGQPLYGHQAPNGYPETGEAWINTGAILNRINFGLAAAAGQLPGVSSPEWVTRIASASRPEQVDGVIAGLLGGEASPETREILESGMNPLLADKRSGSGAATDADSAGAPAAEEMSMQPSRERAAGANKAVRKLGLGGRGDPLGRPSELSGVAKLVGLALGSPEFQRR